MMPGVWGGFRACRSGALGRSNAKGTRLVELCQP